MCRTLDQEIRKYSATAVKSQRCASHATCCSKSRVKRLPATAQGTFSVRTPQLRHRTRQIG